MLLWKQRSGDGATYSNLIQVFERADCQQYADIVKKLALPNASENRGAIGGQFRIIVSGNFMHVVYRGSLYPLEYTPSM